MTYPSITSRTVIIPELSTSFHVNSVELSVASSELLSRIEQPERTDADQELIDKHLVTICQQVFDVSWVDVISFSRWRMVTLALKRIFENPQFKEQILQSYEGQNESSENTDKWIENSHRHVLQLQNQFADPTSFTQGLTRNGLLNPIKQVTGGFNINRFLDSSRAPSLAQSVYKDLSEQGLYELELRNWGNTSRILSSPVLPSTKSAYEELKTYEFPVASSPPTKSYTMQEFQDAVRGVALTTLKRSSYLTVPGAILSAAAGGWTYALVCLLGGPITCLTVISVAQFAPLIEKWIGRIPR